MRIHKHVSQKMIDANRRNCRHGHGPATTRGKEIVRHNATKHGLLARALVFKNEGEQESFRAYRKRLCDELAPANALEMMFVEDLANAEWRLKRATRWEQAIGGRNDATPITENALKTGTEHLGISSEHVAGSSRSWQCQELSFSLKTEKESKAEQFNLTGDPGVILSAKLTDPAGDLGTILRYQRDIRKVRGNCIDRLLKLQRSREKAERRARHNGYKR